ncbi:hypothetical protein J7K42_01525 [bacterium]|nr:hypothetical protein [bacterium]
METFWNIVGIAKEMFWDTVNFARTIIVVMEEAGDMVIGKFYMEVQRMGWLILGVLFIIVLGSLLKKVKPRPLFIVILLAFYISIFAITKKVLVGTMDPKIGVSVVVVVGIFLIVWLVRSILVVSTAKMKGKEISEGERGEREVPVQVILTRFGKAVRALAPGIYWIWWPVDRPKVVLPTIVYKLDIEPFVVHTQAEKESAKLIKVTMTVHMSFPKVGSEYDLSELPDEKIPQPWRDIKEEETLIVKGEELLVNFTYYALSPDIPLDERKMLTHFTRAIEDGVRAEMVKRTYTRCREEKTELEKAIKIYLLTDPANLFVRTGIPPDLLDISIVNMEAVDERIENALWLEEIEATEGRAEARRRIEAIGGAHKGIKASFTKNLPTSEKDRMTHDYVTRQMSLDKNALTDIRVEGAEGVEKSLANLVALAGKLFGKEIQKTPPKEKPREKLPEEMTDEELREVERRMYGE